MSRRWLGVLGLARGAPLASPPVRTDEPAPVGCRGFCGDRSVDAAPVGSGGLAEVDR